MKLHFDIRGNLKPGPPVKLDLSEIEQEFVLGMPNSITRVSLFKSLIAYNQELSKIIGENEITQWINGSFISKKANPRDLDIVSFISSEVVSNNEKELDYFGRKWKNNTFRVDGYFVKLYEKNHRYHNRTISDKLYWSELFGAIRLRGATKLNNKGYVELELNKDELNQRHP